MKKVLLSAVLVLIASSAFASLSGSSHDLSSTGTNPAKGTSDQLCKYCHVPHNAITAAALWARNNGAAAASVYSNPGSMTGGPVTPTLTQSTACLSCHNTSPGTGYDATTNIGAGMTANKVIAEAAGANGGLSDDHPIAFTYNQSLASTDGQLASPANNDVAGLPLYGAINPLGGSLECATCHAVHSTVEPSFLRTTVGGSVICLKCHIK